MNEIETTMENNNLQPIALLKKTVADLCDVDEGFMLDMTIKQQQFVQARWLWWYAVKYLTHYSNRVIARITANDGGNVTLDGVGKGIVKMSKLTSSDLMWKKRWLSIKDVIDGLKQELDIKRDNQPKIKIIASFGIEVEIKRM